jgi:hypothetical protein
VPPYFCGFDEAQRGSQENVAKHTFSIAQCVLVTFPEHDPIHEQNIDLSIEAPFRDLLTHW